MDNLLGQPWGLMRAVLFASAEAAPAALYGVELDPITQTGVRRDATTGRIIEAGKHGTNKQTSRSQRTGGGGDGSAPQPSDQTTVTDYDAD
ncbi:putative ATP-grasp-modified RiPP [Streptosporangium sp. NPDC023825]|uniref:putative ATP-grasp-modified RiPP n=1 Tax=Streptosporangium sp. NPDC023825 TaxID=3154909 RepID=UPI00342C7D16